MSEVERRPNDWPEIRNSILERDEYECQDCGEEVGCRADESVADAEVHHITPVSEGGTHDLENLVTLCAHCHTRRYWDERELAECPDCGRVFRSTHGVKIHQGKSDSPCRKEDADDE